VCDDACVRKAALTVMMRVCGDACVRKAALTLMMRVCVVMHVCTKQHSL